MNSMESGQKPRQANSKPPRQMEFWLDLILREGVFPPKISRVDVGLARTFPRSPTLTPVTTFSNKSQLTTITSLMLGSGTYLNVDVI
ncbi:hypothetical protein ACVJBD_007621 [Rhizobium mongolense]